MSISNETISWKFLKLCIGLVLLAILLVHLNTILDGNDWGDDFALYIDQAKAMGNPNLKLLEKAQTFTLSYSNIKDFSPVFYPWGYPILLKICLYVSPNLITTGKYINLVLLVATLIICFYTFRLLTKSWKAILALTFIASLQYLVIEKNRIESDFFSFFLSILCVYLLIVLWISGYKKENIKTICLLGITIGIAIIVRLQSVTLIPTLFIVQLAYFLKKKQINIWLIVLPYLLIAALNCCVYLFLPFPNYVQSLSSEKNILFTIENNFQWYLTVITGIINADKWRIISFYSLFPFTLVGLWKYSKLMFPYLFFITLTFLALLPIPFTAGLRYLLPIVPLYCFATIEGSFWCWEKIFQKFKLPIINLLPAFAWLGFFLLLLYVNIRIFNKEKSFDAINGPYQQNTLQMVNFIKKRAAKNIVIMALKARIFRSLTGHQTLINNQKQTLELQKAWVIIDKKDIWHPDYNLNLRQKILTWPLWNKQFENDQFEIWAQ